MLREKYSINKRNHICIVKFEKKIEKTKKRKKICLLFRMIYTENVKQKNYQPQLNLKLSPFMWNLTEENKCSWRLIKTQYLNKFVQRFLLY